MTNDSTLADLLVSDATTEAALDLLQRTVGEDCRCTLIDDSTGKQFGYRRLNQSWDGPDPGAISVHVHKSELRYINIEKLRGARKAAQGMANTFGCDVTFEGDVYKPKIQPKPKSQPATADTPTADDAGETKGDNVWSGAAKDLCDDLDNIGAPPTARLVALVMLMHRSKAAGQMWPSYSTIQRYTGLARSTVQLNVDWLLNHGVLKRTRDARRETSEPAHYRFLSPDGWTS